MFKKTLVLAALVALTGCATSKYKCDLGNECIDVYDIYDATLTDGGNKETVVPDLDRSGKPFKNASNSKSKKGSDGAVLGLQSFEPYSGGSMTDKPVYQPPRPIRVWLAPWQVDLDSETQAEPVLMSGQFMYVTVPGFWTMGTLKDAGGMGGPLMLEPYSTEQQGKVIPKRIQPRATLN